MNVQHYLCDMCHYIWSVPNGDGTTHTMPCQTLTCNREHLIPEIDPQMIAIIQVLNKKGYSTTHCCSGHPDGICSYYERDDEFDEFGGEIFHCGKPDLKGFISFKHCYYFQNIPENWHIESDDGYSVLRIKDNIIPYDTPIEYRWIVAQHAINNCINNMIKWCLALPELGDYNPDVNDKLNRERYMFEKRWGLPYQAAGLKLTGVNEED